MKARSLKEVLNIFDPERPLRTEEELRDHFVSRPMSPLEDLAILLRDTTEPQKVLFTGHRGSGKSTELAKLSSELEDQFFIVHYSIKRILNLFDLTYVDVVLSLGLELFEMATSQKVRVKKDVLTHILEFTKEITKEVVIGDIGKTEVGAELNLYVVKLSSKLGTEDATRTIVRETVKHRLSDLMENINLLSREVERHTKRRVLILVEDLDKTDLNTARELFYGHATSLLAPPVTIIYTFPTALRHDNDFMQVRSNFPTIYILPNLKTSSRDGAPDPDGLKRLCEILTRRAEETLFARGVPETLARLSGGIPRELVALVRWACLESLKRTEAVIDTSAVEQAARSKRIDYQVLLTSEQLKLLSEVRQTKKVENDEAHRALLHNLSALEYRNDQGVWYDVHPLIEPLLKEGV